MIGTIEGNSLTLLTRATPTILALLASLEGRRSWLKGGGLKLENTAHNREVLLRNIADLEIQNSLPEVADQANAQQANKFEFRRTPDPHQMIAFEQMQGRHHFGLFMEQGTGKTKVAIDRSAQLFLADEIDAVLVLTKKGVHRQWVESEMPKDCSVAYLADYWKGKPVGADLLKPGRTLKMWAMNWDALRSDHSFGQAVKFCEAHKGRLHIIGDESQCIMTHTSIRHKRSMLLKPYANYRTILTGTPIAKDLTDEWAQLRWLNEEILGVRYITTFRAQYCIMGGYEGRAVVGHKNLDEFKRRVAPHTYRVTKEEIGYIPKRHSEWTFDLTPEQLRLIKQVKQELLADLGEGEVVSVANATAAFSKVQQIANGFIINEHDKPIPVMIAPKNPRLQAMLEWLGANEGKAVIWTRFIADRKLVAWALSQAGIIFSEYTGSEEARYQAKHNFIDDQATQVFLANPQSAGTGLDGLQSVCTQALYYSNSFNAIDRWQSEDRIDRRGMIGSSRYTDLIGVGSTDRYILRNLKKKKGISALSLGDIEDAFDNF